MRRFLTFLTVLISLTAFVAAAQAAATPSLSIKLSGLKVLFGHPLTIAGRLSSGSSGRVVTIEARKLGAARPTMLGSVRTGFNGGWSFVVRPAIETSYQARSGPLVTPALSVDVEPAISVELPASGRIDVRVAGGRSFVGRLIELQAPRGSGWATAARARLDRRSEASFPAPLDHGRATMRIAMSVNAAGRGFLGATSHAFLYRARVFSVSVGSPATSVVFGRAILLSGRISAGARHERVTVLSQRYGSPGISASAVTTAAGGRWRLEVRPSIQTTYRARWQGTTSRGLVLGVHPALAVARLGGGRIAVRVRPARVFVGRRVELQRSLAAGWTTVAQQPLRGPSGVTVFPASAVGSGAVRVAMSVNEAGAGYLGSTSSSLLISRANSVSMTPSAFKVLYGHPLTLSGTISSRARGQAVSVDTHPYGNAAPIQRATVLTGAGGRWSLRVSPSIQTTYVAHWRASGSRPVVVGVVPRISVEQLSGGRVAARILAGRSLAGRLVQLQQLTPQGAWSTVERKSLDPRSSTVFAPVSLTTPKPVVRIAMSVNQAGAGLLGATSHAFTYRLSLGARAGANCPNSPQHIVGLCVGFSAP